MDVSKWPLDEIMQLPDHAFGRRWIVSVGRVGLNNNILYDISELALPEKFVIWEIIWCLDGVAGAAVNMEIALGDLVPTTDPEFQLLTNPIPDLGVAWLGFRYLLLRNYQSWRRMTLRQSVHASGRRLVGRFQETASAAAGAMIALTVSSLPREVPDWLISGRREFRG